MLFFTNYQLFDVQSLLIVGSLYISIFKAPSAGWKRILCARVNILQAPSLLSSSLHLGRVRTQAKVWSVKQESFSCYKSAPPPSSGKQCELFQVRWHLCVLGSTFPFYPRDSVAPSLYLLIRDMTRVFSRNISHHSPASLKWGE